MVHEQELVKDQQFYIPSTTAFNSVFNSVENDQKLMLAKVFPKLALPQNMTAKFNSTGRLPKILKTVLFITLFIFQIFKKIQYRLDFAQLKQNLTSSMKNFVHELPHKLSSYEIRKHQDYLKIKWGQNICFLEKSLTPAVKNQVHIKAGTILSWSCLILLNFFSLFFRKKKISLILQICVRDGYKAYK